MAKVAAKVLGGRSKDFDMDTVGELAQELGVPKHQATVNGEAQDADYELNDHDYVVFTEKVKGATLNTRQALYVASLV